MSILNWNKPAKVASSAEHIATEGVDGGPAYIGADGTQA